MKKLRGSVLFMVAVGVIPAQTTSPGSYAATAAASAPSQAVRSGYSPGDTTKVGTPAARARYRAGMPTRSAPTATTVAG